MLQLSSSISFLTSKADRSDDKNPSITDKKILYNLQLLVKYLIGHRIERERERERENDIHRNNYNSLGNPCPVGPDANSRMQVSAIFQPSYLPPSLPPVWSP